MVRPELGLRRSGASLQRSLPGGEGRGRELGLRLGSTLTRKSRPGATHCEVYAFFNLSRILCRSSPTHCVMQLATAVR